jgi:hypothetical protein
MQVNLVQKSNWNIAFRENRPFFRQKVQKTGSRCGKVME